MSSLEMTTMRVRSLTTAALVTLAFSVSSRTSEAASLALASTSNLYVISSAGSGTFLGGINAGAVVTSPSPISIGPSAGSRDPAPAVDGVTGGSMSLNFVDASQADMSFSFTMFSDANPLIETGIEAGTSDVPVTLRIDEIRYDEPGVRVNLRAPLSGSVTGTLRGSLTVGTSTVPFTILSDSGWSSDGAPPGTLDTNASLGRVVLGYSEYGIYNGGVYSGLGTFPDTDLITVDGVTFTLHKIYPEFLMLT